MPLSSAPSAALPLTLFLLLAGPALSYLTHVPPIISKSRVFAAKQNHHSQLVWQRTPTALTFSAATSLDERGHITPTELVGAAKFVRQNPESDRFKVLSFHHVEIYCGDATNTYRRFQLGLGMNLVAKSDLSTGNPLFASYCLRSQRLQMVFSAPYSMNKVAAEEGSSMGKGEIVERRSSANPGFEASHATQFFNRHGVAVRALGLEVEDARQAYQECVANGGQGVLEPVRLDPSPGVGQDGYLVMSEVQAYGNVVLRFVSRHGGYAGSFLPGYQEETSTAPTTGAKAERSVDYGLERIDHAVGNVWELNEAVTYLKKMTGFHPFAEFVAEDVGTVDSGLNSVVLANNAEDVLIPLNEPTYGTKRKSQIQTYLECNNGPGLQHLALATRDIFTTMRKMRAVSEMGGFTFMAPPPPSYYRALPERLGGSLTASQLAQIEELGLLADKDDQGVLLQVG